MIHTFENSSLVKRAAWHKEPHNGAGSNPELYPLLVIELQSKYSLTPSLYHYYRVPEARFKEFVAAESPSKFYGQNIKGVFSSKKII